MRAKKKNGHFGLQSAVPDRTDHGPGAYDIGVSDRPDKVPIQGSAAVSHRIGFEIAGAIDVFGGCADRDLVLQ